MLSINGLDPPVPGIFYPNIAERFARYQGWLERDDCLSIRFEDLVSERQPELIRADRRVLRPAHDDAVRRRRGGRPDVDAHRPAEVAHLPQRQEGRLAAGVHAAHRARFAEVAGDLLVRLGYEPNLDWAHRRRRHSYLNRPLAAAASASPRMKIIVHDYAGHPFQVQLSRRLAARGHDVLHLYCASTHTPRGELERRADDPPRLQRSRPIGLSRDDSQEPTSSAATCSKRVRVKSSSPLRAIPARRHHLRQHAVDPASTDWHVGARATACRLSSWVQDIYGLAAYRLLGRKLPVIGHARRQLFHLRSTSRRSG